MMPFQTIKFLRKRTKHIKRFNTYEQVLFFQELGELLQSGYSISQSLDILASAHIKWQSWLSSVIEQLRQGQPLHSILKQDVNNQILLQLKLADQHGNLSETLVAIGKSLANLQQQQNKVKQVMRYPLILLGILGAMLIGLKYFLYPILNQWQDNPLTNHRAYYLYFYLFAGSIIFSLGIVSIMWIRKNARQKLLLLAKIPVFGTIIRTIVTYQVTQQLAILLASGLTIPEILDEISQEKLVDGRTTFMIANHARRSLQKGYTIESYILEQPYLNKSLAGYFSRGHEPKVLAKYLSYYTKTQFQLLMQQTDRLIGVIQPLFFGVIGIAIVSLYVSMLLPMYKSIGGLYQ